MIALRTVPGKSIFISSARRKRAALSRPVMQPVRRPAMWARSAWHAS
jgi:hypothetical protein